MNIQNYDLSLKAYISSCTVKTNIVLHGSFSRTKYTFTAEQKDETCLMKTWNIMADKYSGHYVIGRNGNIYNCVAEEFWTQHIGPAKKFNELNKSTIAVFLTNELYLEKENGKYYAFGFNKPYNMYTGKVFQLPFKGYDYWADYDKPQIQSLVCLLKDLCARNDMDPSLYKNTTKFDPSVVDRATIVSCANLNKDSRSLPLPDWVFSEISAGGIALIE